VRAASWRLCLAIVCWCSFAIPAGAQPQKLPEDPEDEKRIGLWFDQGISVNLPSNRSLEFEFHQRSDKGASNLFEYFGQGGVAFRPRRWLTVIPIYTVRPQTSYEDRLLLNATFSTTRGRWRLNLRTLTEARFPENLRASARVRFRPGIDYTLPFRMRRPPVLMVNNEFLMVPGPNSFESGGAFTQNRSQAGVLIPITASFSIRTYCMLQFVNLPGGWDTNGIAGISIAIKTAR